MAQILFISPVQGDVLMDQADGEVHEGKLCLEVSVQAEQSDLRINGIEAVREADGLLHAILPMDHGRNVLTACDGAGNQAQITVYRLKDAYKTYRFTVDDCIRCFEDLNSHPEYTSIFDSPFLEVFHQAHQLYGARAHMNVFYASPDSSFNLSMMTDRFREQFRQNADWLSFTFHARSEFPDAPYRNASYEELRHDCQQVVREIIRFAGPEVLRDSTTLHFGACTIEGVRALRDEGYRSLCGYLAVNRRGETLVAYHLTPEQARRAQTREGFWDEETGLLITRLDLVLNALELTADRVEPFLDQLSERPHESGLIQMVIHEQYFYSDYPVYEPDYAQRILAMARWLAGHGYHSVSHSDLMA